MGAGEVREDERTAAVADDVATASVCPKLESTPATPGLAGKTVGRVKPSQSDREPVGVARWLEYPTAVVEETVAPRPCAGMLMRDAPRMGDMDPAMPPVRSTSPNECSRSDSSVLRPSMSTEPVGVNRAARPGLPRPSTVCRRCVCAEDAVLIAAALCSRVMEADGGDDGSRDRRLLCFMTCMVDETTSPSTASTAPLLLLLTTNVGVVAVWKIAELVIGCPLCPSNNGECDRTSVAAPAIPVLDTRWRVGKSGDDEPARAMPVDDVGTSARLTTRPGDGVVLERRVDTGTPYLLCATRVCSESSAKPMAVRLPKDMLVAARVLTAPLDRREESPVDAV